MCWVSSHGLLYIDAFNPCNNSVRKILLPFLFYRWGNSGTESLSSFHQHSQLLNCENWLSIPGCLASEFIFLICVKFRYLINIETWWRKADKSLTGWNRMILIEESQKTGSWRVIMGESNGETTDQWWLEWKKRVLGDRNPERIKAELPQ